jgi:hypothetical protein
MNTLARLCMISAGALCLGASAAWSQVKVTTPDCSIAFGSGWAMFDSAELAIIKDDGVNGLAIIRSSPDEGSAPLDLTQEAQAAGDSLDANLTLTKDETKTIGAYPVRIFTLSYDTLHRVERVAKAHGRTNTFRNGSLRVYVIRSGGVRVNIIGVYAVSLFTPYSSIEQAIPSLAITNATGIPGFARPAAAWSVSGGKLRFQGKGPVEVSALDVRGRQVARLRGDIGANGANVGANGANGAEWDLPSGLGPVYLTARFGNDRPSPLGWWRGQP